MRITSSLLILCLVLCLSACSPLSSPSPTLTPEQVSSPILDLPAPPATPTETQVHLSSTEPALPDTLPSTDPGTQAPPEETLPPPTFPPPETPTPLVLPTLGSTPFKMPTPPLAAIRITRPGLQSRLLSPFRVEISARPTTNARLQIALLGEDGRVLFSQTLRYSPTITEQVFLQLEVEFAISGPAEAARLMAWNTDEFGRLISLSSVDLVLLSIGDDLLTPPVNLRESLFIIRPYANEFFSNGLLSLQGWISPVSSQPVLIEVISEDNAVLFTATLDVGPVTPERFYVPFEISIPYSVPAYTRARLTLRQDSDSRLPGTVVLASQQISLSP